jgi:hypothetical protein
MGGMGGMGGSVPPPPTGGMGGTMPPPPTDGGLRPPPMGMDGGAPPPTGTGGSGGGTPPAGGSGGSGGTACVAPSGAGLEIHNGAGYSSGAFFDGNHASISCGSFLVGTPNAATSGGAAAGAATVFTWSGSAWNTEQKLIASDGKTTDLFGEGAALDGDRAIVGAPNKDDGMSGPTCSLPDCISAVGAAYVFSRSGSTWTQEQKITTSDEQSNGHFGQAVAISGTTAAVASPLHAINVKNGTLITTQHYAGIVEIYLRGPLGKWVLQSKLAASDALEYDGAGRSLALVGNALVVGAPGNVLGSSALPGRVFVYDRSSTTWTRDAVVTAADGAADDHFGVAVALSGTTMVVGADGDDDAGDGSGSVYVFVGSGASWTQQQKLVPADAAAGARFGASVAAVSPDHIVVGAPGAGKIYSFTRAGGVWAQDAVHTACSGTPGQSLGASGTLAVSSGAGSWVFDLADADTSCVPN